MSEGGRTSQTDGAWLPRMQANWPTGGGVVVVVVEVLVEEDVVVLLVVVLLVVVLLVVLLVVGAMVVVVVEVLVEEDVVVLLVVVLLVVLLVVGAMVVVASHPVATRTTVMIGSVTSLVNGSALAIAMPLPQSANARVRAVAPLRQARPPSPTGPSVGASLDGSHPSASSRTAQADLLDVAVAQPAPHSDADRPVVDEPGEMPARAGRGGVVPVATDPAWRDVECCAAPRHDVDERAELRPRHALGVEVPLAHHQQVAACVVLGRRVAMGRERASFVHVAVPVDDRVVGDVGPAEGLVVALVPAEVARGVSVVSQGDGAVVDGDPDDLMVAELARRRLGAPGTLADHFEAAGSRGDFRSEQDADQPCPRGDDETPSVEPRPLVAEGAVLAHRR
jgi:hypothetical protein